MRRLALLGAMVVLVQACGDDDSSKTTQCVPDQAGTCDGGLVCEAVAGGDPVCVPETVVTGRVFNAETDAGISGANVVVVDPRTNAAVTNVAVTDASGNYQVRLRLQRSTDAAANVTSASFTLRVSARRYQDFPSPLRQAIPLTVTRADNASALPNNTRDVALLALGGNNLETLGTISGRVREGETGVDGVLVVAEGGSESRSAISDASGSFSIFNVAPGSYTVSGYQANRVFTPVSGLTLANAEDKTGVVLDVDAAGQLFTLTGGIQIVNGQTTTTETLIVLALASTREVPAGLSVMTAGGLFELAGIPPGTYDILASYNNDDLVLDPDPSQLPRPIRINLPTDAVGGTTLDVGSFKITGDVKIVSPGAALTEQTEEPVDPTGLTFTWEDDSSEDFYGVEVFDAFGARIWGSEPSKTVEPAVKVPKNAVSLAYGGPALNPGATYQWRITSYKCNNNHVPCDSLDPISSSENLRGIFEIAK